MPITFNRYAYAADNPMTYVDPDGRFFDGVEQVIGVVVGGYSGYQVAGLKGLIVGAAAGGFASLGSAFLSSEAGTTAAVALNATTDIGMNAAAGVASGAIENGYQGSNSWSNFNTQAFKDSFSSESMLSNGIAAGLGHFIVIPGKKSYMESGLPGKLIYTSHSTLLTFSTQAAWNSNGDNTYGVLSDHLAGSTMDWMNDYTSSFNQYQESLGSQNSYFRGAGLYANKHGFNIPIGFGF